LASADQWLDQLPLPAVVIRNARFAYVNEAFLELLALTREQAIGMKLEDRVAPEDVERVRRRHLSRVKGETVPSQYQLNVVRGDGQRRTVEIFVSHHEDDTYFMLYDLTGRVMHQVNLQGLARLGAAVQREQTEDGVFRAVDRGLRTLEAAVVRLAPDGDGVAILQTLGSLGQLKTDLTPEVVAGRRPWTPNLRRAWAEGYAFLDDLRQVSVSFFGPPHEAVVHRSLEERKWVRGSMIRLDVLGAPREVLLVMAAWLRAEDQPTLALFGAQIGAALDAAQAIRALSHRNAQLSALNHVAGAAGTVSSLDELFSHAAREVENVTGSCSVVLFLIDEPKQEAFMAHQHGGGPLVAQAFARVPLPGSKLGQVIDSRSTVILGREDYDERARALMVRLDMHKVVSIPMMSRGRVIGVINVVYPTPKAIGAQQVELLEAMAAHLAAAFESNRLVEDLRRSYDDLSRAQAQLVQRERLAALGEMAAALAHEVRNPLGVIFNSLASLPREIAAGNSGGALLAIMKEESDRINHLVGDLLDFARPTQPLLSDELPLAAAINEAVVAVLALATSKIDFQLRYEEGCPERVPMDARLMRQVFFNLANNAMQAMPHGGSLKVTVSAEKLAAEQRVRVVFADSGHGIPAPLLPRVFEPFFTTRARGTGLGLALVKRIVEGHRGEVVVASGVPTGTQVVVAWPTSAS
jgi:PAS domain S-box-containing protein